MIDVKLIRVRNPIFAVIVLPFKMVRWDSPTQWSPWATVISKDEERLVTRKLCGLHC